MLDRHFRHADGRGRWQGAWVLDAFAGTGALAMEALSRGAARVTAWDVSPRQAKALYDLAATYPALTADQSSALTPPTTQAPVDLLFLDPPYGQGLVAQALGTLEQRGWVGPQTLIYAETEQGVRLPSSFMKLEERTNAGSLLRSVSYTHLTLPTKA